MNVQTIVVIAMLAAFVGFAIAVLSMMALYSLKTVREEIIRDIDNLRRDVVDDIERNVSNINSVYNTIINDNQKTFEYVDNKFIDVSREIDLCKRDSSDYSKKLNQDMDGVVKNWVDAIYTDIKLETDKCKSYSDSKCDKLEERIKSKN